MSRNKMKSLGLIFFLFLFVSSIGIYASETQAANPMVLKLGHVYPGGKYYRHVSLEKMASYVKDKTKGAISMKIYPMGQLGGERALLDQVLAGSLDMSPLSATILATVCPEFYFVSLPFAFPNENVYWDLVNLPDFKARVAKLMWDKAEVKLISFKQCAFRGLQNTKHPIRRPSDFEGIKMRVMHGSIFTDLYRAMGVSTATIPVPELYSALQQGVVDGEDVTLSYANRMKFSEIEKFATELNAVLSSNPVIMAGSTWTKLTKEQQQWFMDCDPMMVQYDRGEKGKEDKHAIKEFVTTYKGNFISNSDLKSDEREAFEKRVMPIWKKYRPIMGEDFFKFFLENLNKVRQKHGFLPIKS